MKKYFLLCLIGIFFVYGKETADIIVAKDGSEKFTSIQSAINSIPKNNTKNVIILIKKGTYNEKIFITNSFISLVGEDRDSTCIVYGELRKNWVKDHSSDWGSATLNIDSSVTDVIIANLTVRNNYGSLYGDHDHQFAIWGKGTRISILYCNIIGDGGDTVSLWNSNDGMYYHSNCYFEGWVDYVCPRGWCYITDSRFYGHNLTASLWHNGSLNDDQKFVIRYSYLDGVPKFPLGRHHADGQFYFLDCIFSKNLADEQIHYPNYSPNAKPWKWGARHYYFNCHREGGDYDWFQSNLSTAKGAPSEDQITAKWTFAGKWDPGETTPSVLPFVSLIIPRDGAYGVNKNSVILHWRPSRFAQSYNLYFGKTLSQEFVKSLKDNYFSPNSIESNTRYYWRIDEVCGNDTLRGPLWHFTTL